MASGGNQATATPSTGEKETLYEHIDANDTKREHIAVDNNLAFKGDDSDGQVDWTLRHSIAALSLGMLYAGELYFIIPLTLGFRWSTELAFNADNLSLNRFANNALLCGRLP